MKRAPESWISVALSEVVAINPGIDKSRFSYDDELPFVPMPAVEAGTGRIDISERRPFKKVKSGFTAFASGDVLFAKITPCMENGKMAVVPDLPEGVGFGTTEFHILRPTRAVDARLLYYFVSSASVRHEAQHNMTGAVGQKRVPKRFLEIKEFPLPPLNEQHRIVEKIETLFARIDKGEEALREVQKLLKRYRQSILKAAVTGELTRDWRETNQHKLEPASDLLAWILETRRENWKGRGKYKEPIEPDATYLPNLPANWQWASLGQLLYGIEAGKNYWCLERPPNGDEFGIVKISAVTWEEFNEDESKTITDANRVNLQYLIKAGDLLMSRANTIELVGASVVVDRITKQLQLSDKVLRLKLVAPLENWINTVLRSPIGRKQIEMFATGAQMSMRNISQKNIERIAIPLPSHHEIDAISAVVGSCFNKGRNLKSICEAELTRSYGLRQSILKSAFTGQLVPQDPDDEPASQLLARIRAEREATPAKAKSRRKARA